MVNDKPKIDDEDDLSLTRIARDMRAMLLEMREITKYMRDAETEVPERVRRFIMYFHDVHDMQNLYNELGIPPPLHIKQEIERCADRFKHILEDMYDKDKHGGFERVREEMTQRGGNRYDWSRALAKPEKGS
jgi:hypothetical protein